MVCPVLLLHNYERRKNCFFIQNSLRAVQTFGQLLLCSLFCLASRKHFDSDDKEVGGGGGFANVIISGIVCVLAGTS